VWRISEKTFPPRKSFANSLPRSALKEKATGTQTVKFNPFFPADIETSEWSGSPSKQRTVSLTLTLTHPMGPKNSQCTETQSMPAGKSRPGEVYVVDIETANAGIPYADSFCVMLHFCLHKVDQRKTHLTVYGGIKYKKSVWGLVKSESRGEANKLEGLFFLTDFIEKNTYQGLAEFYQSLAKALDEECDSGRDNSSAAGAGDAGANRKGEARDISIPLRSCYCQIRFRFVLIALLKRQLMMK